MLDGALIADGDGSRQTIKAIIYHRLSFAMLCYACLLCMAWSMLRRHCTCWVFRLSASNKAFLYTRWSVFFKHRSFHPFRPSRYSCRSNHGIRPLIPVAHC